MFSHNFTLIMMCDEPTYCTRFPVPVTLPDYQNISGIVPLFSKDGLQPANYSGRLGCSPGFSGVGFCRITNCLCRGEAVSPTYWRAQIVFIVATLQLTEGHRLHHPPLPSIFYSRSVFPFTHASRVPMNIVFIVKSFSSNFFFASIKT